MGSYVLLVRLSAREWRHVKSITRARMHSHKLCMFPHALLHIRTVRVDALECLHAAIVCVKGAIIVGLLFVTFISWIPNHAASYLGGSSDITGGVLCSIILSFLYLLICFSLHGCTGSVISCCHFLYSMLYHCMLAQLACPLGAIMTDPCCFSEQWSLCSS